MAARLRLICAPPPPTMNLCKEIDRTGKGADMPVTHFLRPYLAVAIAAGLLCGGAAAQQAGEKPRRTITVATKEAPPFAMKMADGQWTGFSIDLWEHIAEGETFETRYLETDLEGMLAALQEGRADVAVAALTVTAEREEAVDFGHPFLSTGLGIAVPAHGRGATWMAALLGLFTLDFLKVVAALATLLFFVGALVWAVERRRNSDQFGGPALRGLGAGFWWSAVTMTTVGYGDKAPVTGAGRFIALVWMFAGVITISGFTAAIATTLTVGSLGTDIKGPQDLPGYRIATIADSTSEAYLSGRYLTTTSFATLDEALSAVVDEQADVMVHDAPILRYAATTRFKGRIQVVPGSFERQDYAFAFPQESALREQVNRALLETFSSHTWQSIRDKYLGE